MFLIGLAFTSSSLNDYWVENLTFLEGDLETLVFKDIIFNYNNSSLIIKNLKFVY